MAFAFDSWETLSRPEKSFNDTIRKLCLCYMEERKLEVSHALKTSTYLPSFEISVNTILTYRKNRNSISLNEFYMSLELSSTIRRYKNYLDQHQGLTGAIRPGSKVEFYMCRIK